jgi:hypothetical protein
MVPFQFEITSFQKRLWDLVLKKLLVLIAILLELPEQYFVERHEYDKPSGDYLCYVRKLFKCFPYINAHEPRIFVEIISCPYG